MSKYKCLKCNKVFSNKSGYNYHVNNKKNSCDENLKLQKKHDKKFIKNSDDRFECPKCHKSYLTKGNAKRHYYDLCIYDDDISSNKNNSKHVDDDIITNLKQDNIIILDEINKFDNFATKNDKFIVDNFAHDQNNNNYIDSDSEEVNTIKAGSAPHCNPNIQTKTTICHRKLWKVVYRMRILPKKVFKKRCRITT